MRAAWQSDGWPRALRAWRRAPPAAGPASSWLALAERGAAGVRGRRRRGCRDGHAARGRPGRSDAGSRSGGGPRRAGPGAACGAHRAGSMGRRSSICSRPRTGGRPYRARDGRHRRRRASARRLAATRSLPVPVGLDHARPRLLRLRRPPRRHAANRRGGGPDRADPPDRADLAHAGRAVRRRPRSRARFGAPVALSDGHRLVASAGDGGRRTVFAALAGTRGRRASSRQGGRPARRRGPGLGERLALGARRRCQRPRRRALAPIRAVARPWPVSASPASGALLLGRARARRVQNDRRRAPRMRDPGRRNSRRSHRQRRPSTPRRSAARRPRWGRRARRPTTPACSAATACCGASTAAAWRTSTRRRCTAPRDSAACSSSSASPELAHNRRAVDQFIDEAKLGSTLVHPNIVPVFDFGKVGDGYFMAQEYIVGRDIARLLRAPRRADRQAARRAS